METPDCAASMNSYPISSHQGQYYHLACGSDEHSVRQQENERRNMGTQSTCIANLIPPPQQRSMNNDMYSLNTLASISSECSLPALNVASLNTPEGILVSHTCTSVEDHILSKSPRTASAMPENTSQREHECLLGSNHAVLTDHLLGKNGSPEIDCVFNNNAVGISSPSEASFQPNVPIVVTVTCHACHNTMMLTVCEKSEEDFDRKFDRMFCVSCGVMQKQKPVLSESTIQQSIAETCKKPSDYAFTCEDCGETFPQQTLLDAHANINHSVMSVIKAESIEDQITGMSNKINLRKRRKVNIDQCPNAVQNDSDSNETGMAVKVPKKYVCDICNKSLSTIGSLKSHMLIHGNVKPFQCSHCDRSFLQKHSCQAHEAAIHTKELRFRCSTCGKGCPTKYKLKRHYDVHVSTLDFACDKCDAKFVSSPRLKEHISQKHATDDKLTRYQKYATCDVCGVNMKHVNLGRHMMIHNSDKKHVCDVCGKPFLRLVGLKSHQRVHTHEKPYSCSDCDKRFSSSSGLTTHLRTHTGIKNYTCVICGKSFAQSGSLQKHERIHTGVRPFVCSTCGHSFIDRDKLARHVNSKHLHLKKFDCDICGRGFLERRQLGIHMRIHSGEKPYLCTECGKSFRSHSNLATHFLIHRGIKRFVCIYCEKQFTKKEQLQRHERTHTGQRPYKCNHCSRSFTQTPARNRHQGSCLSSKDNHVITPWEILRKISPDSALDNTAFN